MLRKPASYDTNKIIAFFVVAVIVVIFIIIAVMFVQQIRKSMEAEAVAKTCEIYYSDIVDGQVETFRIRASHDSEPKDGYGSCDVYDLIGRLVLQLECDASVWFNSGNCKTAKAKL